MSELKPCPFCGGDDVDVDFTYIDEGVEYYAECTDCYCRGAGEPTPEKARSAWNTRPGEDKMQERVDALEWLRECEELHKNLGHWHPYFHTCAELTAILVAARAAVGVE